MTNTAVIGIGTNLGNRTYNIEKALLYMRSYISYDGIIISSNIYETAPIVLNNDNKVHNNYLNLVVYLHCALHYDRLLKKLKDIESMMGRDHSLQHWSSRIIDLDIISYGDLVVNLPHLCIPHEEMHKRDFVLKPLAEILPNWTYPGQSRLSGKSAAQILSGLDEHCILNQYIHWAG